MNEPLENQNSDEELRLAFISHLAERIAAIEDNWQTLSRVNWNPNKLDTFYRRIQDLAGSSGKYGLVQVSEGAFSLEVYLSSFIDSDIQPTSVQKEEIHTLLEALRTVAEDEAVPLEESSSLLQTKNVAIFYLRTHEDIAPGLVAALEALDCDVLSFSRTDDLLEEMRKRLPQALVIDTALLPLLKKLEQELNRLKVEHGIELPMSFLSASSDLSVRLRTLRTGANSFFVTPIDASSTAIKIKKLAVPEPQPPFRVLVVEDDVGQAEFAAQILRKARMEVRIINEPLKVIQTMDEFRPDLVLMDIYMPEADGLELTAIIREHNQFVSIPIVFLSGELNRDKQVDALSVGADDFIAKPVRPAHLISIINSRVKRARDMLARTSSQSKRDPVTGLFNRRHFFERLEKILATESAPSEQSGVLYLRINNLADLQSRIGIGHTDALLAELGTVIAKHVEPQDICSRISDDGFAIIANRPDAKQVEHLAIELQDAVRAQTESKTGDQQHAVHTSVGICLFSSDLEDASGVVSRAEKACNTVPNKPQGNVQLYTTEEETKEDPQKPDTWLLDLVHEALLKSSFQVLFQPMVDLHDRNRESYELMLRLRTEEGDHLSEPQFLSVTQREEPDTLKDIDRWVIIKALTVLGQRRMESTQINLLVGQSTHSLLGKEYTLWIREQLRSRQLVGTGLILEYDVLELVDHLKVAKDQIFALREMGISVSLKNFTANKAAFKVLKFMGNEYVKVAAQLLNAKKKVIQGVVSNAHKLGARVIVPRVENPKTIDRHWSSGADFIQGNYIQRPEEGLNYEF